MKLSHLLHESCIFPGLPGNDRPQEQILREVLEPLFKNTSLGQEDVTLDELLAAMVAREREHSTAIGNGFAFPHVRITNLKGCYMALALFPEGIAFHAVDQQPVHFMIYSIVPRSQPNLLLMSRAAIMRFLAPEDIRHSILSETDPHRIWQAIDDSQVNIEHEILARDIMRPSRGHVSLDMSLREVAEMFHLYRVDALPVLDEDGRILHEINCHDLFTYGLPDFFSQLHTVSFVRKMNPFERYFEVDVSMRVSKLPLDHSPPVIAHDATIMEIIFELSFGSQPKLYVEDDKKLVGVIDRFRIIDKILVSALQREKA